MQTTHYARGGLGIASVAQMRSYIAQGAGKPMTSKECFGNEGWAIKVTSTEFKIDVVTDWLHSS